MRASTLLSALVICFAQGCWDFPQGRYNQDAVSKDAVAVDLRNDGPGLDKPKTLDKPKPLDKPKTLDKPKPLDKPPPLDKQNPLDKQKPPPDQPPMPDQQPPMPDQKVLLAKGANCAKPADCQSGICAQGRCCGSTCAAKCMACDLGGLEGNCSPVPSGQDPHNSCNLDPAPTCGLDGTCDGKGQCRKHLPGTECAVSGCAKSNIVGIKHCDGNGNCNHAPDKNCFPYNCNPANTQCHSSCTSGNQNSTCAGYYACNTGNNQCYSSCSYDKHCKSSGECNKSSQKCKKD